MNCAVGKALNAESCVRVLCSAACRGSNHCCKTVLGEKFKGARVDMVMQYRSGYGIFFHLQACLSSPSRPGLQINLASKAPRKNHQNYAPTALWSHQALPELGPSNRQGSLAGHRYFLGDKVECDRPAHGGGCC
jgi:hypothetical protein